MQYKLLFNTISESFNSALRNLMGNKVRTFLSLLGVFVGVFCITGILTLVDSLELNIREVFSKLGDDVYYIQKQSWGGDENVSAKSMINRPDVTLREKRLLEKRYEYVDAISFSSWLPGMTIKTSDEEISGITVMPVNASYLDLYPMNFNQGTFFSKSHDKAGNAVAVIGYNIYEALFDGEDALNKFIQIKGRKIKVIGVIEKEGNNLFNNSNDKAVFLPVGFAQSFLKVDAFGGAIVVKTNKEDINEAKFELMGVMRSIRRLKPTQENNFSVNQISSITDRLSSFFDTVSLIGWVLAAFSILVGGFGIANIMFVTVKERTPLIGIEKALGAHNLYIMVQFLGEAIVLCVIGGCAGILCIGVIALIVNSISDFTMYLTLGNVLSGVILSAIIGLASGFIPARQAARLAPIEAIRA